MSDVCALDGCDEPIEQQEGAPPRKYCCQAHRAAARSRRAVARRAAEPWEPAELVEPGDPTSGPAPETDEADPLYLQIGAAVRQVIDDEGETDEEPPRAPERPAPERPTPAREDTPPSPSRVPVALSRQPVPLESLRRRPRWATPRTALAAGIAAAMVLGGGSTLFAMNGQPVVAVPSPSPLPAAGAQWLDKANLALASTTEQLTQLDAAEKRWQQSTTTRRASNPPPAVTALEARRAFLQSQRSILASQVAAWQNLQQSNAALATADQQLAALGAAADQPGQSTDTQHQLDEQRATLSSRSQMLRDEAARWQQDVAIASSAPMPDTTPAPTTTVLAAVDGLQHGTPDPGRDEERGDGNSVLAERSPHSGDRERDLPGTGAPPRPDDDGAPASEGASRPDHGGVVTALTRPVTGLLDGPRGGRGTESRGGDQPTDAGSRHTAPRDHDGGPVARVAGTADDLVDRAGSTLTGRGRTEAAPHQQDAPSTPADDGSSRERGSQRALLAQSPGAPAPGLQAVHDVVGKAFDLRDQADQGGGETSATGVASTVMKVGDTVYRVTANGARSAGKTSADSSTRAPSKGSSRAQTSDDQGTAAAHSGGDTQKAARSRSSDHSSSDQATASEVRSAASALRAQSAFIREYAKTRSAQAVSTGDQGRKDVAKAVEQAQARADEAVGKALAAVSSHGGSSSRTSSGSDQGGSSGHGSSSRSTSKDSGSAKSGSTSSQKSSSRSEDSSSKNSSSKDSSSKDSSSKDSSSKDSSSKNSGSKDSGSKDSGSKDSGSKDSGTKSSKGSGSGDSGS